MVTNEKLREYADSLDPIYREILGAFTRIEPNRKKGYGLAIQSIAVDLEKRLKGIGVGEIIQACAELEKHELAQTKNGIFVHPTPLGERLISVITGKEAPEIKVPKLPPPPK